MVCSTAQHSTAQHSTAQHSTAQHSTRDMFGPGLQLADTVIVMTLNTPVAEPYY
jgi:uncharacterized Zn ribbon protein